MSLSFFGSKKLEYSAFVSSCSLESSVKRLSTIDLPGFLRRKWEKRCSCLFSADSRLESRYLDLLRTTSHMLRFVTFTVKSSIREPRLGLLLADHSVVNLSHDGTFPTDMMSLIKNGEKSLFERARKLIKTPPTSAIISAEDVTLLPPIVPTRNILCIGKNYLDHVNEVTFLKTNDKTTTTPSSSSNSSSSDATSNTVSVPAAPIFFTKVWPRLIFTLVELLKSNLT